MFVPSYRLKACKTCVNLSTHIFTWTVALISSAWLYDASGIIIFFPIMVMHKKNNRKNTVNTYRISWNFYHIVPMQTSLRLGSNKLRTYQPGKIIICQERGQGRSCLPQLLMELGSENRSGNFVSGLHEMGMKSVTESNLPPPRAALFHFVRLGGVYFQTNG